VKLLAAFAHIEEGGESPEVCSHRKVTLHNFAQNAESWSQSKIRRRQSIHLEPLLVRIDVITSSQAQTGEKSGAAGMFVLGQRKWVLGRARL
jgi:hypothetical protein